MHPTKHDLPQKERTKVVALLNARLADTMDLYSHVRQAHWNVKGPQFMALHTLFEGLYDQVAEHADMLAERAAQLGGQVLGTTRAVHKATTLPEYPLDASSCPAHVDAVSTSLAAVAKALRDAIDECDRLGDQDTADLFTEISRAADKSLWMVESHSVHADAKYTAPKAPASIKAVR